jgi:hypothetical protein
MRLNARVSSRLRRSSCRRHAHGEIAAAHAARGLDQFGQRRDLPVGKAQRHPHRQQDQRQADDEQRDVEAQLQRRALRVSVS